MGRLVTRAEIADLLCNWQSGLLTAEQVHQWADDLYFPGSLDFDDWEGDEDNSVANEVLSALSMLDMNLVVREDVPVYLAFLQTPRGGFVDGYRAFVEAQSQIDHEIRRRALDGVSPYGRFCEGPGDSASPGPS